MKKLIFIIAILFSVNCSAQDTTYFLKRNKLYEVVKKQVNETDTNTKLKYEKIRLTKQRNFRRTNRVAFGIFILFTIAVWRK